MNYKQLIDEARAFPAEKLLNQMADALEAATTPAPDVAGADIARRLLDCIHNGTMHEYRQIAVQESEDLARAHINLATALLAADAARVRAEAEESNTTLDVQINALQNALSDAFLQGWRRADITPRTTGCASAAKEEYLREVHPTHSQLVAYKSNYTRLSDKLAQVERERDVFAQYHGGHLPTCGGRDEMEGRCDCGYLQGEAYRGLVEERDALRAERDAAIARAEHAEGQCLAMQAQAEHDMQALQSATARAEEAEKELQRVFMYDVPGYLERVEKAEKESADWDKSFWAYHAAVARATEAWRAANPGNENVLPDTAKALCAYYDAAERDRAELANLRSELIRLRDYDALASRLAEAEENASNLHMTYRKASEDGFAAVRAILRLDDKENLQSACYRIMGELDALSDRLAEAERDISMRREGQRTMTAHRHDLEAQLDAAIARAEAAEAIIENALSALPVGYLPAHTPESIPSRITSLMERCAEMDRIEDERDTLRAELAKLGPEMLDFSGDTERTIRVVNQ